MAIPQKVDKAYVDCRIASLFAMTFKCFFTAPLWQSHKDQILLYVYFVIRIIISHQMRRANGPPHSYTSFTCHEYFLAAVYEYTISTITAANRRPSIMNTLG